MRAYAKPGHTAGGRTIIMQVRLHLCLLVEWSPKELALLLFFSELSFCLLHYGCSRCVFPPAAVVVFALYLPLPAHSRVLPPRTAKSLLACGYCGGFKSKNKGKDCSEQSSPTESPVICHVITLSSGMSGKSSNYYTWVLLKICSRCPFVFINSISKIGYSHKTQKTIIS